MVGLAELVVMLFLVQIPVLVGLADMVAMQRVLLAWSLLELVGLAGRVLVEACCSSAMALGRLLFLVLLTPEVAAIARPTSGR